MLYQNIVINKKKLINLKAFHEERYISFSKNINVGEHYEYKEKKYIDENCN